MNYLIKVNFVKNLKQKNTIFEKIWKIMLLHLNYLS